jgi:hypothetical protein
VEQIDVVVRNVQVQITEIDWFIVKGFFSFAFLLAAPVARRFAMLGGKDTAALNKYTTHSNIRTPTTYSHYRFYNKHTTFW